MQPTLCTLCDQRAYTRQPCCYRCAYSLAVLYSNSDALQSHQAIDQGVAALHCTVWWCVCSGCNARQPSLLALPLCARHQDVSVASSTRGLLT